MPGQATHEAEADDLTGQVNHDVSELVGAHVPPPKVEPKTEGRGAMPGKHNPPARGGVLHMPGGHELPGPDWVLRSLLLAVAPRHVQHATQRLREPYSRVKREGDHALTKVQLDQQKRLVFAGFNT